VKPKWKDHVFFAPTKEGVLIKGPSGTVELRGSSLYPLLERLLPYLQGQRDLAELTAPLSPERRTMVTNLIHQLAERGFVQDLADDAPHELTQTELTTYADPIAFIAEWQSSAARRFQRFRWATVAAVGRGRPLLGLVRGLARLGLQRVLIMTDDTNIAPRLAAEIAAQQARDPLFGVEERPLPAIADGEAWRKQLAFLDAVAIVGDQDLSPLAEQVTGPARKAGARVITGLSLDGAGWVGPLFSPERPGCWRCALARLRAPGEVESAGATLPWVGEIMLGQQAAFELFKELTGASQPQSDGAVLQINGADLSAVQRRVAPWPLCETCQRPTTDLTAVLNAWREASPLSPAEAWERAERLIDPVTGLLARIDPGTMTQAPLARCSAVLRLPGSPVVTAADRDHDGARYSALRLGLQSYAEQITEWAGDTMGAITPDGTLHPQIDARSLPFVSGHTVPEWIGLGLLASAARELWAIAQAKAVPLVHVTANELDPWTHLLWKTVTIRYGLPLQLYRPAAPQSGPAQLLLLVSNGHLLTVAAERTAGAALQRALLTVTHALQALPEDERPLDWRAKQPVITRVNEGAPVAIAATEEIPAWEIWTAGALAAHKAAGRTVLLRPATTDPAVAEAGLLTGWVGLA
jgi:bacteriocin biosynthesis cyclodehydratase domain-containing protein